MHLWHGKRHLASDSNLRLHPVLLVRKGREIKDHTTFIFLSRVMISTASLDKGTGEPIPMSFPVSRGRSFVGVDDCSSLAPVVLVSDSGLPDASVYDLR